MDSSGDGDGKKKRRPKFIRIVDCHVCGDKANDHIHYGAICKFQTTTKNKICRFYGVSTYKDLQKYPVEFFFFNISTLICDDRANNHIHGAIFATFFA